MHVIIDNGHGCGTPGKCSPDCRLKEWKYTREVATALLERLAQCGIDASLLVAEDRDVPLGERCRRANEICRRHGVDQTILVSIHCNAADSDMKWHMPHGWSVFVSANASRASRSLATALFRSAEAAGLSTRCPSPSSCYWTLSLAICRDTLCPAILTENLFQDNRADVDFLLSAKGFNTIVDLHVKGILDYIKSCKGERGRA